MRRTCSATRPVRSDDSRADRDVGDGAYTAQAVVTRTGFRLVGVAGMVLAGLACLLLTQVSVDGSYFEDIFLGLLVLVTGLGAAFVASQIAALAGVAEEESGLAAGLVDSSFNIGGAPRDRDPLHCCRVTRRRCVERWRSRGRAERDDRGLPDGVRRLGWPCRARRSAGCASLPTAARERSDKQFNVRSIDEEDGVI